MKNKDFYTQVVSGVLTEEAIAHARNELEKMEARNAKRRDKAVEKRAERIKDVKDDLLSILNNSTMTAAQIADQYNTIHNLEGDARINSARITTWMKLMVEAGYATVSDVKVPGKGKRKAYCAN